MAGCGSIKFPGAYKPVIQQGNIISQEDIDQLKPGMTKRQVNFVLGTPLITDSFNPSRWDYIYTIRDTSGTFTQKRLTVFFNEDKLSHFVGDYKPSEPVAPEATPEAETPVANEAPSETERDELSNN